jgi:hypothetical protein
MLLSDCGRLTGNLPLPIKEGLPTIRELNGSVNTAEFHSAVARLAGKAGCPLDMAQDIFQTGGRATATLRTPPSLLSI